MRSGQLRYTEASISDRSVSKRVYIGYLQIVKRNATRLLEGIKVIKEATKGQIITNHQIVREMLRVLSDGDVSIISEKEHMKAINEYLSHLARAAESIRRELLPIAIIVSNYYDEANRRLIDLEAVILFLMPMLNHTLKQRIDEVLQANSRASSVNIKQELKGLSNEELGLDIDRFDDLIQERELESNTDAVLKESNIAITRSKGKEKIQASNISASPPHANNIDQASDVQIADVQIADVQIVDVQASDVQALDVQAPVLVTGEASIPPAQTTKKHRSKPPIEPKSIMNTSSLPEIFMIKILGAHFCHYADYNVDFEVRIKSKVIRKLTKDMRVKLTENIKLRIEWKIREKFEAEVKPKIIQQMKKAITAEVRANLKQELKKELLASWGPI